MDYRNILTTSFANIDLNSASQTRALKFIFPKSRKHAAPISLLRCTNPLRTCLYIKNWLVNSFNNHDYAAYGIVRIEPQDLHLLSNDQSGHAKEGWILLAEDAAYLGGGSTDHNATAQTTKGMPVSIIAILVPGDSRVRWFYMLLPISPLLQYLDNLKLIRLLQSWDPGSYHHKRFQSYIREGFLAAVTIPESLDFLNAEQLTDYCPSILEPDEAVQRLEQNEFLYSALRNPEASTLDVSDDRYLLHLPPAEREIASLSNLKCAEYMLVKRNFFKVFFEEIYRSDKKIDPNASSAPTRSIDISAQCADSVPASRQSSEAPPSVSVTPRRSGRGDRGAEQTPSIPDSARRGGARHGLRNRVRTEHAHQGWLEREYEFRSSRAKMVIVAWRELGFLDEGRYLHWVQAGGMLENAKLGGDVRGEEIEIVDGYTVEIAQLEV